MVPGLLAAWFAWELFGPARARRLMHVGLVTAVVLLLPLNVVKGYGWRAWYTAGVAAVERDIAAGVTAETLAHRHHRFLMHWDEEGLVQRIDMLRRSGIGPFAGVRADPPPEDDLGSDH
jgi:hypothetical protein